MVPYFRSPPQRLGAHRTIRRAESGRPTVFVALRGLAPTRLRAAGMVAGGLAGAAAALVYAVHCNEMALPFLAVWYVLGMFVPAALGAAAGPRFLRWV